MLRAHLIRLRPTKSQESYFLRACGTRRFVYNWGLARWNEIHQAGEKPSAFGLKKEFNSIKKSLYPWVMDVTKCAVEGAFTDLGRAFTNFFRSIKNGDRKFRYPQLKKKGKSRDSFKLNNDQFAVRNKTIRIPNLGFVKMYESLRFEGKIMSATVSRRADMWFVSILVDTEQPEPTLKNHETMGLDVGLDTYCQLSTSVEDKIKSPKPLKTHLKKLKRLQREVSRKVKGSNNRKKAVMKLARQHYKVSCIRGDFQHKLSHHLATTVEHLGIEDLNLKGLMANHNMAKAFADAAFYEFFRQLEYKKQLYGGTVTKAGRFYPSTKTCNNCGCIKDSMTLKDRTYVCEHCGYACDRDYNAALNIQNIVLRTVGSTGTNACGQNSLYLTA